MSDVFQLKWWFIVQMGVVSVMKWSYNFICAFDSSGTWGEVLLADFKSSQFYLYNTFKTTKLAQSASQHKILKVKQQRS